MRSFKPKNRRNGLVFILIITIIFNLSVFFASIYINDYVLNIFLRMFLVAFNIYQIYYMLKCYTMYYEIDKDEFKIVTFWGLYKKTTKL